MKMGKKRLVGLVCVLTIGLGFYGCARVLDENVANPNMSLTPGSPPAGTTQVKLSGGNISAGGASLNFNFMALNQDDQSLTNITRGNLTVEVYDSDPAAAAVGASNIVAQAVIEATFDDIVSGSNSTLPLAIAMTLDKSGSMFPTKVKTLEAAAESFVDLMSSDSMAAIINFDDNVSREVSMTTNKILLKQGITDEARYGGWTAIYSAIHAALSEEATVSPNNYTRAILAMTDGQDNKSYLYGHSEGTVTPEAILWGVPIYTIGFFDDTAEAVSYRAPLERIAAVTTGTSESYYEVIAGVTAVGVSAQSVGSLTALSEIYTKLQRALTNAYRVRCTLATSLNSGQQYWLKMSLSNYGDFSETLILPFIAD